MRKIFTDMHGRGILSSFPIVANLEAKLLPFSIYWECKVLFFLFSAQSPMGEKGEKPFGSISQIMLKSYLCKCNFGSF